MKKNSRVITVISFLLFILSFGQFGFAQNKQTVVVRPETYREKQERQMRDVAEFLKDLGEFSSSGTSKAEYLNNVKNSRYSMFVDKKLAEWKKKSEFEKTESWQKRLADSTAIKRAEIQAFSVEEYAEELKVAGKTLNDTFYDSNGKYDADREVLIVNTFWGNISIPIPLEKARNMQNDIKYLNYLEVDFFIQNDQLALLSLTFFNNKFSEKYTYENPSQAAQAVRKRKAMELAEQEKIYEDVEQPPSFRGGESAMYEWLSKNINYPVIAQENNIQGRVTCRFIVEQNGEIEDIEVVRGVDPSLDREAVRVIKSMPKWIPGRQGGNAVRVRCTLPIQFRTH